MKTKITRRKSLVGVLLSALSFLGIAQAPKSRHKKVVWVRLTDEPLGPGDMWASTDPNTPERQGSTNYNLQMQSVHPNLYGKQPGTNCVNGWHWRPLSVINC